MATHSSFLAWKIPWTEEPGGLQPWRHKESDTTEHTCLRIEKSPVRASGEGLTPPGEMQQCLPGVWSGSGIDLKEEVIRGYSLREGHSCGAQCALDTRQVEYAEARGI